MKIIIFKKIANFLEKSKYFLGFRNKISPEYGKLYKLKDEELPFRYVYCRGDNEKGIYRFKHHKLKQYLFHNFDKIHREANENEKKLYNLIKEHVNDIASQTNNSYHN